MPYISQDNRSRISDGEAPSTPGQLNYQLTTRILQPAWESSAADLLQMAGDYWLENPTRYQTANDVIGALSCCELELLRRGVASPGDGRCQLLAQVKVEFYKIIVGPYEDRARQRNGDLPGFDNHHTQPRVYLAAQYSWRDKLREHTHKLRDAGVIVTSSWLQETESTTADLGEFSPEFLREHAEIDECDIRNSDVLVLFTVVPTELTKRGGRHVEFGIAYALGKRVIVCGPLENIFHYLPGVEYCPTFNDLLKTLTGDKA